MVGRRGRLPARVSLALFLTAVVSLAVPLAAQPPVELAPAGPQSTQAEAVESVPGTPNPNRVKRDRIVTAGVVLLAVVVVLGIGLLATVLLLGARTRRIAREPLHDCRPRDEYWFLRNRVDSPSSDSSPAPLPPSREDSGETA